MNDAQITVIGWLASDPYYTVTSNGTPYMALRLGCTPRRFDRQSGQWTDQPSMFLTVNCWRMLAENLNASDMKRGDPLLVTGRLRIREYARDGQMRFSAEVEATTVGHDLSRGSAQFRRVQRGVATETDRQEAREVTDQWSLGGGSQTGTESDTDTQETTPASERSGAYLTDERPDSEATGERSDTGLMDDRSEAGATGNHPESTATDIIRIDDEDDDSQDRDPYGLRADAA